MLPKEKYVINMPLLHVKFIFCLAKNFSFHFYHELNTIWSCKFCSDCHSSYLLKGLFATFKIFFFKVQLLLDVLYVKFIFCLPKNYSFQFYHELNTIWSCKFCSDSHSSYFLKSLFATFNFFLNYNFS